MWIIWPPLHATGLVHTLLKYVDNQSSLHTTGLVHANTVKYVDNQSSLHVTRLVQTLLKMWIIISPPHAAG